jgi:hypothetical protein
MNTFPNHLPAPLHVVFVALLPRIERHGAVYFRHIKDPCQKEELIAEAVGLAWKWCVRLSQRGKDVRKFPSAIASFAARAVGSGRRLCGQEKSKDVLSLLAQRWHGFRLEALPTSTCARHEGHYSAVHGQDRQDAFEERLGDNRQTPVPDQAAFRIDFPAWLDTLSRRDCQVIEALMDGERTTDVAAAIGLSPGRVSQLRREFHDDWLRFLDGVPAAVQPGAAAKQVEKLVREIEGKGRRHVA